MIDVLLVLLTAAALVVTIALAVRAFRRPDVVVTVASPEECSACLKPIENTSDRHVVVETYQEEEGGTAMAAPFHAGCCPGGCREGGHDGQA